MDLTERPCFNEEGGREDGGQPGTPGKEELQMKTCLHQTGQGPCLWSTFLTADWLEGAGTKQVGVGCVKRLVDHEPKSKLEKKHSVVCASVPALVSLNDGL